MWKYLPATDCGAVEQLNCDVSAMRISKAGMSLGSAVASFAARYITIFSSIQLIRKAVGSQQLDRFHYPNRALSPNADLECADLSALWSARLVAPFESG